MIYVEGGGRGALRDACRQAFSAFLCKAGLESRMPRIYACGSRYDAYEDFKIALQQGGSSINAFPQSAIPNISCSGDPIALDMVGASDLFGINRDAHIWFLSVFHAKKLVLRHTRKQALPRS